MSNHVHMLITPRIPVPKLMQALKGFTAREANRILGRKGEAFWQHESYDHWVRDARQFERIARYIEDNPVRAGLCASPADYRFSSAYAGEDAGMASLEARSTGPGA
jgi:REP element-mobilizing transposase RayT